MFVPLEAARYAQDAGYPDINIIAEKVAAEGQTRFEDRYRLPIGISVNMTSYSGKLLTAALYNPRLIMVYAQARLAPCGSKRSQITCRAPAAFHASDMKTLLQTNGCAVRIVPSQRPDAARAAAQMGDTCELSVQAAAALCGEGEELSYWQLMVRASCEQAMALASVVNSLPGNGPARLGNTCLVRTVGTARNDCTPA